MTEDEALKRWCPEVKFIASGTSFYDSRTMQAISITPAPSSTAIAAQFLCIGSKCMMWRFDEKFGGYCGLAGKP